MEWPDLNRLIRRNNGAIQVTGVPSSTVTAHRIITRARVYTLHS